MENCYGAPGRVLDWAAVAICLGGFLYALGGFISTASPKTMVAVPLAPLNPNQPGIAGSAFAVDALPGLGPPSYLKGSVALYGSFLAGSGDSTGSVVSAVYPAVPDFYMFVSGYPNRPGNRLLLEVETSSHQKVIKQVAPFEDTGGKWLLKRISLRAIEGAVSFRILATDANKGPEGWLGFSLPFLDRQSGGRTGLLIAKQIWFTLLALAAAMAAFWAPGLMLRRAWLRVHHRLFSPVWIVVPGLLALALLGVAAWVGINGTGANQIGVIKIGSYQMLPDLFCRVPLMIFFAIAAVYFFRIRLSSVVTESEMRLLAVTLTVIAIAAGKSMYSLGPVGELFHQEISRTLEIGGRSDNRLPYYVTQLVGKQQLPTSPFARELYGTWTFSDRGQLVALAAAPLVLAGPTSMPDHKPEDAWTVFDPQGFTAYRCAMIVLAASTLFFVYGVSQLFLPDGWTLLACLVTATSPFFIHEIYFTWPKLEAAAFVLLAGYLVLRSRFLLAGLALGLGYMCHPSALLSTPALLCLLLLFPRTAGTERAALWRRALQVTTRAAWVMLGLAFWLVLWRLVNQSDYTQTQFLGFASASGNLARTPANWLKFRLDSLLDTLVPLNQFLFHSTDDNVNAVEGPSPAIVRFFVQPWSTVPAGAGLLYFFCLLRMVYLAVVRRPGWTLALLVVPLLVFTAYMGIDRSGMLKEGLHAWFITLMIFSVVMWRQARRETRWFWKLCAVALLTRVVDLLGMMILPVIWTQHAVVEPPFVLSDLVALGLMAGGTIWLCWYSYRLAEDLRSKTIGRGIRELPKVG